MMKEFKSSMKTVEILIYCALTNEIGILDSNYKDYSMVGFYIKDEFRLTAFPVFLGEL